MSRPSENSPAVVNSMESEPHLFGQQCRRWDRAGIEKTLDYFQIEHSKKYNKISLFHLLDQTVVQDRGVDEATISATELLRFIIRDDGIASQPPIGRKPRHLGNGDRGLIASGPPGEVQDSMKEEWKASKDQKPINEKDCGLKTPVQDCAVCATELLRTVNTPWRRIASQCGHQSTICLSCLQQHVQNQLATITCDKISCPICGVALSSDDIQAWSAPDFFARYMRISIQQAIQGSLSFRWCGVSRMPKRLPL